MNRGVGEQGQCLTRAEKPVHANSLRSRWSHTVRASGVTGGRRFESCRRDVWKYKTQYRKNTTMKQTQIQIRKDCELELMAAPVASGRSIANVVFRKGVSGKCYAFASDGHGAVISECGPNTEMEGELVIAANKYGAIRRAKMTRNEKRVGFKAIETVEVLVGDTVKQMIQSGEDLIAPTPVCRDGYPMPDIHKVFADCVGYVPCISFNPSLLYTLCKAMGSKSVCTIALPDDKCKPMIVLPGDTARCSVGLLMPVRDSEDHNAMQRAYNLIAESAKMLAPAPLPTVPQIPPIAEVPTVEPKKDGAP